MIRSLTRPFAVVVVAALAALTPGCGGCAPTPTEDGGVPLGDGFERVVALDETTVVLTLARALDPVSVVPSAFGVTRFTVVPPEAVSVVAVELSGAAEVTIDTGTLVPGETYTLAVDLRDADGFSIAGTLNFVAQGSLATTEVTIAVVDDAVAQTWSGLSLLVSVDGETGDFSERLEPFPLTAEGGRLVARVPVRVDPARTAPTTDDDDPGVDRRAYAARVVDDAVRMASPLVRFEVATSAPAEIVIPLVPAPEIVVPPQPDIFPDPPVDASPDDGVKLVRIVVDDRAARELSDASVKLSFTTAGDFDPSFPESVPLVAMTGDFEGFFEAQVGVKVDPDRTLTGDTLETFPYIAYLVQDGVEYEGLSVNMIAPDETPGTAQIFLGDPAWTPVTFRIDAGAAFVNPTGSTRGTYPGEAVFLTGEWQNAVDAFGNNCGDGFSGGEQRNLKMRELDGHPGVWTRTLWLPPGRPYGWKAVRCNAADGCGPLNQLVASSGRAFATVMKNLVTENIDAFADPNVAVIDPAALSAVMVGDQAIDYSSASVYVGDGNGSEPDPAGTPDGMRMFKQEVPDLVVVVADDPVITRVFVVGSWRDVNLGQTPEEIIATSAVVELNPFDYDDGFVGRYPPSREDP